MNAAQLKVWKRTVVTILGFTQDSNGKHKNPSQDGR